MKTVYDFLMMPIAFIKSFRFSKSEFDEFIEFVRKDEMTLALFKPLYWLIVACLYLMAVCGLTMAWVSISNFLSINKEVIEYVTPLIILASFLVVAKVFECMKGKVEGAIKNKIKLVIVGFTYHTLHDYFMWISENAMNSYKRSLYEKYKASAYDEEQAKLNTTRGNDEMVN